MSQAESERREYGQIVTGPGGLLPPVPENEQLLQVIGETSPLEPAALLKIAESYKQYPTNVSLGNHLALLALATRDKEQVVQEAFTEYATVSLWDLIEDGAEVVLGKPVDDPDEPEGVKKARFIVQLAVRLVNFSRIGLLVETATIQSFPDEEIETGHFIIGVSPGPALRVDLAGGDEAGKKTRIRVRKTPRRRWRDLDTTGEP